MKGTDLLALLPLLVLAAAIVGVMLLIAIRRDHRLCAGAAVLGLVLAAASLGIAAPRAPRQVTPLFVIDGYALLYVGLVILAALAVALLSYGYL